MSERVLIVNADDFGASPGLNAGIVQAHVVGIVTSASLMVHGRAATHAAAHARDHPGLGVGLHWDLDSHEAPPCDLTDPEAIRAELGAQLQRFAQLVGRPPTHVDTHHHVHRRPGVGAVARELAATAGVPLREHGPVRYLGGFYGRPSPGVSDPELIGTEALLAILRDDVVPGISELGCHPGRWTGDHVSTYGAERELELRTLCDPRVRQEVATLGIRLAGFAQAVSDVAQSTSRARVTDR